MNEHGGHRPHVALAALIESMARAARALLVLDECQPDEVRTDVVTMPAERLFWTLTQLDDGLALDVCQALVRASRLSQGTYPASSNLNGELAAAEAAAQVTAAWLRRRWAAQPDLTELAAWFTRDDLATAPVAPELSGAEHGVRLMALVTPYAATAPQERLPHPMASWLDTPPLVGPPPRAELSLPALRPARPYLRWRWSWLLAGILVLISLAVDWQPEALLLVPALVVAGGTVARQSIMRRGGRS